MRASLSYCKISAITLIRAHMHRDSDLRSGRMCATSIPRYRQFELHTTHIILHPTDQNSFEFLVLGIEN